MQVTPNTPVPMGTHESIASTLLYISLMQYINKLREICLLCVIFTACGRSTWDKQGDELANIRHIIHNCY